MDTDSYTLESPKRMIGGNKNVDIPNGGFPPIVICKAEGEEEKDEGEKKKREYVTHKTAVSIKNILEKRRNVEPLIKTD